jgi:hypothetical protein
MVYELGWTTLPGLRGLSVSEFRAVEAQAAAEPGGVRVEFRDRAEREAFLKEAEAEFAARRFSNAADAFDTVKAWALGRAGQERG